MPPTRALLLAVVVFLPATVLLAPTAVAQYTSQEISGFVRDSTGAVVPGAEVSAQNTATAQSRSTLANESGLYVLANLPIGTYELRAESTGFKKFVKTGLVLTVNSKLTVDVTLEVGNISESVTVNADA